MRYRVNGKEVSRSVFLKTKCSSGLASMTTPPACWPRWSDAMGIHPNQIEEARAADMALGVSAEFCEKTGRIKFESKRHEKQYCEAHGHYQLNGGYGCAQRK